MAYEYEEIIVKQHLSNFRSKTGKLIDTKESLELREVYAKAKAFDEIKEVIKKSEFYDRDTALDIIEIVEDLEDKQND
ncbi:hypothetical protein [Mammaliicoccus sciuri]|uniref:hypothetical protein n=1 Tax=Mammaliicoccus sciuri TaxID=1296 RepID=UPI002DBFECFE|nr:hypothetical protein [Mammaliicoccus sciuri]MEB8131535.1 hypothetical protein [Mammaliicoccus sciuri]